MSAEHRSKFAALHRQWIRLHMSEKLSSGTKNHKQTKTMEVRVFFYCVWQSPYLLKTERQALRLTTFQYLRVHSTCTVVHIYVTTA